MTHAKREIVTGLYEKGQDTLHWVVVVYTWSCRNKPLFKDLKLEKEEEGEGGGRWAIYTGFVSGDLALGPAKWLYGSVAVELL